MSKYCPIVKGKVVYLECLECDDKVCEKDKDKLPLKIQAPKKQLSKDSSIIVDDEKTETTKRTCEHKCDNCCNKEGEEVHVFNKKETKVILCKLYKNALLNKEKMKEGCKYHQIDMSKERICMNCKSFIGGGDWGLGCATHYYKLPVPLDKACDDFNMIHTTDNIEVESKKEVTLQDLEAVMKEYNVVIRVVPEKVRSVVEARHIKDYPNGKIVYLEEYKREMCVSIDVPKNAGKFIYSVVNHTCAGVQFNVNNTFNTIEELIDHVKTNVKKIHWE